jgi:hypothetical protein
MYTLPDRRPLDRRDLRQIPNEEIVRLRDNAACKARTIFTGKVSDRTAPRRAVQRPESGAQFLLTIT